MLNWFTFGVMFLTIVLLLATCIIQSIKKDSEDYAIEHLINLQKHIIDELTEENEDLKNKNASLKKQINLMQSCDLAKVMKKQQKEIEKLKNGGKK